MKRVPDTGHQLYIDGDTLYRDMLRSIDLARHRVWIESYIFAADHTGRRFGAALARAARRGLDVRLHLDAAGSLFLIPRTFLKTLGLSGVQVRTFHRWSWRDPWRYNRRNHCKLLITDSASVYLGGFNIHDQSSWISSGDRCWRDTHVRLDRLDLVRQAADVFNLFWTRRLPRRLRHAEPPDQFGSLFHNYEINFVTDNPEIRRGIETIFESDLSESTEITLTGLRKFGLWERLGGRIGWRLRWWL